MNENNSSLTFIYISKISVIFSSSGDFSETRVSTTMATVLNLSVISTVRDGQALSSNSGYRYSKSNSFFSDRDAFSY